jgi:hypothetical protein
VPGQPNNDLWLTVTQCVFIKLLVFSPTRPRYYTKSAAGKGCRIFCLVEQVLEMSNEFINGFKAVLEFKY